MILLSIQLTGKHVHKCIILNCEHVHQTGGCDVLLFSVLLRFGSLRLSLSDRLTLDGGPTATLRRQRHGDQLTSNVAQWLVNRGYFDIFLSKICSLQVLPILHVMVTPSSSFKTHHNPTCPLSAISQLLWTRLP